MFRKIEAWHYRSLEHVSVELSPMNILIGPNASGKSTFLDIFAFLQKALKDDVEKAVRERGRSLRELVWKQEDVGEGFKLAIEAEIPEGLQGEYPYLRYEIWMGLNKDNSLGIRGENLFFLRGEYVAEDIFTKGDGKDSDEAFSVVVSKRTFDVPQIGSKESQMLLILHKKITAQSHDFFRSEINNEEFNIRLPKHRLILSGLTEDYNEFPASLWFRQQLLEKVIILNLDTTKMRDMSPADADSTFQPDGSNLPHIVQQLKEKNKERFDWWIGHLQTVLPDLETIDVIEWPSNRSLYVSISYKNGVQVPSWLLSDGTLRLLALTIIAYLPDTNYIYMIEEPENGLHPQALEAVFQSLSSVYEGQVFVATHSPLFLNMAKPEQLIIFTKNENGATEIVRGDQHPDLKNWERSISLGDVFASGMLE